MPHALRLTLAIATLALAACASAPVPVDHYYRLEVPASAAAPVRAAPDVLVEPFEAHGVYAERALLVVGDEPGAPLAQYHNRFWSEPPTLLLDDALRASLRAALGEARVHGRDTRARPDFVIKPRLRRLEQRIDASGAATAVLEVDYVVNDASNGPRFVLQQSHSGPQGAATPEAFVAALGPLVQAANAALVERLRSEFQR